MDFNAYKMKLKKIEIYFGNYMYFFMVIVYL